VIPRFLHDRGIAQVLAPIATYAGHLWTRVDAFAVILYPYIAGRNGFEASLSERQWISLGAALRGIHTATVPPSLGAQIPRERYSPHWRDRVRTFQSQVEEATFADPVAAELAAFLRARRAEISHLVGRADALGSALRARSPAPVLCHADIHGGNVLIGADGALHIVDWDTLTFAPKERDLMFVGAGIFGVWNGAREGGMVLSGLRSDGGRSGGARVLPLRADRRGHRRLRRATAADRRRGCRPRASAALLPRSIRAERCGGDRLSNGSGAGRERGQSIEVLDTGW